MKSFLQHSLQLPYRFFRENSYRTFLRLLLRYGNAKRFVQTKITFNGITFIVPDVVSFVWQYKEIMLDRCYEFKTDSSQPLIIDCGANAGLASFFFAMKFPHAKIIAFEADKKISEIAKQNIALNKITNVEVVNKAVWINEDELSFSTEGADGGSLIRNSSEKQKVKAIRLRDVVMSYKKVDMLKIDIEGAETDVILDCDEALLNVENLFVEFHSFSNSKQKLSHVLTSLEKNGFRYNMENNYRLKQPFLNKSTDKAMDMQLNIFAYRQ